MSLEVVGEVETVESLEKGGAKVVVRTSTGQTRTLRFASNYQQATPALGDYGKFVYREWKPDDWGPDRSAMKMVDGFEEMTPPAVSGGSPLSNGQTFHPPGSNTPRTSQEITATEILNQSKELVAHLISIGSIKTLDEVQSAWIALGEDGMTWHRQTTTSIKSEATSDQ